MPKLPQMLKQEPLVEALFEVRLSGNCPLADILPGFLYHELKPQPTIQRLPTANLPPPMRASDPNLHFTPVQQLEWENYFISVGDRNVQIRCKFPYPKWHKFKGTILKIIQQIAKFCITEKVIRYSVKYVNLIQAATLSEQMEKIKLAIKLGDIKVEADNVSLQVQRKEGDVVHILSVINNASSNITNEKTTSGVIVDIDSFRQLDNLDFSTFATNFEEGLEQLRQANKEKFFGCLTDRTIEELGPIYE
ncbi:MAG: TIGR04255 family protein [Gammaproteobacteria bacterium]|nr:TIGR04255 family protein [Gammaproteobacteria bacterium]